MASDTGGAKAFSIQGRLYRERERMIGMTDKERAWRRQWFRDQHLAPDEPRVVPEMHKELYNPIRRAYWKPLDSLFKALEPVLGKNVALASRVVTGKLLMAVATLYAAAYYFKYNGNDWTRKGGWRVITNRKACLPGDPNYPQAPSRSVGADYADRGFKNSPI
uniref:Putative ubiquinone oxidoreductase ndufb6/b17 subunit n=1 Tax=Panstrongylus megistus TaxID=65343 RepID=A0A069DWA7_9HEMI